MVNKTLKRALSIFISSSMILSCSVGATEIRKEAKLTLNQAIEQLKNLSETEIPLSMSGDMKGEFLQGRSKVSPDINVSSPEIVNIIVEFNSEPIAIQRQSKAYTLQGNEKLKKEHDEFKSLLNTMNGQRVELEGVKESAINCTVNINSEYTEIFNGIAISINASKIPELANSPNVKRIWIDYEVKADPQIMEDEVYGKYGDELRNNMKIEGFESVKSTANADNSMEPFMQDTVKALGIDKLHKENIKGQGIKVGVLDTGVDYNHPDLKDHFAGRDYIGYDFVDMDDDPMETTYEDWKKANAQNPAQAPEYAQNGSAYYTSHGTHVSGTVAGQGKNNVDYKVTGVAPDAELYVYRVLGPYGSGATSGIMAAVEQSVKDGMKVINMSLGAGYNDPMNPMSIAVNNAALAGVVPVVAAGNAGTDSAGNIYMGSVGSPGASPLAITVGASSTDHILQTYNTTIGNEQFEIQLLARDFSNKILELKGKTLEVVEASYGRETDFSNIDVKGKVVLIKRGEITFAEKIINATKKGAEAVIVYNNVDGDIPYYLGEMVGISSVYKLSKEDGEKMLSEINKGNQTITFGETGTYINKGNLLADFSSRGPVNGTFDIKPDIVASGADVFSTYPEFINDKTSDERYDLAYSRISGTSMAAPHIAGIAALVIQEHPEYTPEEVKAAIMNTATNLDKEYSVFEVGAGRVDAYRAVKTNTLFMVEDTVNNKKEPFGSNIETITHRTGSVRFGNLYVGEDELENKTLTIYNNDKENKKYNISYEFIFDNRGSDLIGSLDGEKEGVKIHLKDSVIVESGKEATVNVVPEVPNTAKIGIYEGYIYLVNADDPTDTTKLPFAIRYSEKGLTFELDRHAHVSEGFHPFTDPFLTGTLSLRNPMKYVDLLLLDGKTDEPIGFLFRGDASNVPTGILLGMDVMQRGYYALTGDSENPISNEVAVPKEGYYKVACIGIDKEGNSYIVKEDLMIDNKAPILTVDNFKPIYEIDESDFTVEEDFNGVEHNAYWIKGKIYDDTIEKLRELGHTELNQGNNILFLFLNGFPYMQMNLNENGEFKIGLTEEDLQYFPLEYGLFALDYAVAGDFGESIQCVKKGDLYYTATCDNINVNVEEKFNIQIKGENIANAAKIEIVPSLYNDDVVFGEVTATQELKAYAEALGATVKVEKGESWMGDTTFLISLVDESGMPIAINGDMPLVNIPTSINGGDGLSAMFSVSTIDMDGNLIPREVIYTNYPKLNRTGANVRLRFLLQGLTETYASDYKDTSKLKEIYILDENGKRIEFEYDSIFGNYVLKNVNANQKLTLVAKAPGHLTMKTDLELTVNGEVKDIDSRVGLMAGDINGDNIIDMLDAMLIYEKLGTKDSSLVEDLNGNGVVDNIDLYFISYGFGQFNNEGKGKKPVLEVNGKTFEDLLKDAQDQGVFMFALGDETFTPGKAFNIKFGLAEIEEPGTTEYTVMIAQYDENNKLIKKDDSIVYKNFEIVYKNIKVTPTQNAKTIKIFMWDNLNNMNVLSKKLTIKNNN